MYYKQQRFLNLKGCKVPYAYAQPNFKDKLFLSLAKFILPIFKSLGNEGWIVKTIKVKKCQNHCTLITYVNAVNFTVFISTYILQLTTYLCHL
jgi:hypothetical protein